MRIQLAEILSRGSGTMHLEAPLEMDEMEVGAERFALAGKSPVALSITHLGGRMVQIEGSCEVSAKIPCGRCLEEVETSFSVRFSRKAEVKRAGEGRNGEADEELFIVGTELDVEQLIHHELLAQWPLRVLCREDCKGICSRCGMNLNYHTCGCSQESLDPRMAVARDIFNQFKEV